MNPTPELEQRATPGGGTDGGAGTDAARAALEPPSVVVLTRNEEVNIGTCLRGLSFTDDVVVLDSDSTDRTVEIARQFPNVRVVRREFDTEYKQRNFSLHGVQYKHRWLYICDADELVPEDLLAEILREDQRRLPHRRRLPAPVQELLPREMDQARRGYPVWIIRLVRPELVSYEVRETNVHPIVRGNVGELNGHFLHYSFNSGLKRWFSKHNFYSTREAIEGAKVREGGLPSWRTLGRTDPMLRRRTLKNLSYFLKGRALWRFLYTFFVRNGWLDGPAGLHYSLDDRHVRVLDRAEGARVRVALGRQNRRLARRATDADSPGAPDAVAAEPVA